MNEKQIRKKLKDKIWLVNYYKEQLNHWGRKEKPDWVKAYNKAKKQKRYYENMYEDIKLKKLEVKYNKEIEEWIKYKEENKIIIG